MEKGKDDKRTPEESAEMFERIIKASVKSNIPIRKPAKEEDSKTNKRGSKHK